MTSFNYMHNCFKELVVPVTITCDTDKALSRGERINIVKSLEIDSNVIVLLKHINAGSMFFYSRSIISNVLTLLFNENIIT